ncbi:xanthine dehydrogenase subunit XdhA [Escherichia coli]|uniref:Xanthine dehydrogenase subunit XdhA n=1 Tax=Escherichia coli TaxID=562 RepID=A0A377CXH2_ECOLX|nr:xanthine dehydrogenase subunit XdhA [Escherichia coli]
MKFVYATPPREGDANPLTGKRIYSAGLPECLEKGRKIFEWEKRRAECQNQQGNLRRGVGVACFSYTSNTWPVGVEIAGARLLMNQDGTINVQSGATEIGQGADNRLLANGWQKPWGFRSATFAVISTQDTDVTPFDPGAFASRQSYVAAPALRSAALLLKRENHRSRRSHATSVSDESDPDKRPISCWLNDRKSR